MNEGQDTGSGLGGAGDRLGFDALSSGGGGQQSANVQPVQPVVSGQPVGTGQSVNTMRPTGLMGAVPPMQSVGTGQPAQPAQPVQPIQPAQPVSSGTGDIVLAPEKKSKKGVIIAIIVALVLAGALLAVAFATLGGGGNSGVSGDAKTAFNRYANYLLYGEDSDKELEGEYDVDEIYYLDDIMTEDIDYTEEVRETLEVADESNNNFDGGDDSDIKADDFFLRAENLWNSFYNTLERGGSYLIDAANEYREELELYKMIVLSGDSIGSNWIQNRLDEMEAEQAKEWIKLRYSDFLTSEYSIVKNYGKKAIEYYTLYIDNGAALNGAGCKSDDNGNIVCEEDTYTEIANMLVKTLSELVSEKNKASVDVASKCWTLRDSLNGVSRNDQD